MTGTPAPAEGPAPSEGPAPAGGLASTEGSLAPHAGRWWLAFLGLGGVVVLGYALSPSRIVQDVLYAALGLGAVAALLLGVRTHRPVLASPWYLMAAGQFLWVLGDAWYSWYEDVLGISPFPSLADLWYLAAYPVIGLGLHRLIRARERRIDRASLLDSLIVTAGLGLLLWVVSIGPILGSDNGSALAALVALAYPIGDIVLIAGVVRLSTSTVGHTAAVRLLMAALACVVVADTLYSATDLVGPDDQRWLEYLWLASYLLWGAAGLHPSMGLLSRPGAERSRSFGTRRLLAMALATLVAPVALAFENVRGLGTDVWGVVIGSAVIFLLVVLRMKLAIDHMASLVEQRSLLQEELAFQASHDALTELPNRAEVMTALRLALGRARARRTRVAVLFLDLDGFKQVNDTYGHRAGDEVLRVVATRLTAELRPDDTAGRLGGDEFLVVLDAVPGVAEARSVAERLIEALSRPIPLAAGPQATIGACVGISLSGGLQIDADALLHEADLAVYRAKRSGRGRVEVAGASADPELGSPVAPDLTAVLRQAIADDEFRVVYQPVVSLPGRGARGFEALVRWARPGGGMVPPGEFVPLAEASDLITELDTWVLNAVARQLSAWSRNEVMREIPVAVNISGRHINQERLLDDVVGALQAHRVEPRRLVLEITETVPVEDGVPVTNLHRLRQLGVRVSLDDFGTGYSTIDTLSRLPIDIVKIDRIFLDGSSRARTKMLALLVRAARSYDIPIVGEGVEREEQVAALQSLGVELAQGFLFGRPMPADEAERFVRTHGVGVAR